MSVTLLQTSECRLHHPQFMTNIKRFQSIINAKTKSLNAIMTYKNLYVTFVLQYLCLDSNLSGLTSLPSLWVACRIRVAKYVSYEDTDLNNIQQTVVKTLCITCCHFNLLFVSSAKLQGVPKKLPFSNWAMISINKSIFWLERDNIGMSSYRKR